ncbi:SRPBCC domain-containing protein [Streptomyces sp. SL13]|uniref:SRPBCC domain-containing protein n=1 Tax=Streptantibioticus silvisoli TaxID=2705255 RepID=A0AA90H1B4_9ACTN|nr:SRPBCC domain-containing protein [Streptantibioticus silvisoli]MDI5971484.1 SRPBCC domain-containing protein [Streptantibioticus silvisoli]
MNAVQDRIEREITINASVERVWSLISVPGWWAGDGDASEQKRRTEGEWSVIEDPKYGTFRVRPAGSEPHRYASYRWVVGESVGVDVEPSEEDTTLVEFWLSELTGGATLVRVLESGFASLTGSDEHRRLSIDSHAEGWRQQLDILKARAEHVAV